MPRRPRSADDPPKRTPSFVCEVPLRVSRAQERTLLARLEAARQVYNACLGEARRRVRLVRESKAYQHARTLPRDDPARKERFREARAQHGLLGVRAARLRPAVRALLAGRASGQPDDPDAGQSGLPRRQSAARGEGPPGPVQGPAPAGHRRGQDQHQRPPLVRGPGGVEGTGAAGAPRSARPGAGPRAAPARSSTCAWSAASSGSGIASTPSWCARGRRTRSRSTSWAAGSSGWTWDPRPSRWSPSRPRSSSRSVPRWLPTRRRCAGWTGSSIGSAGPTTRPTTMSGAGSSEARSAGRCPNASGRCRPGGARCTGSWRPRASAATGSSPIGCWGWAAPSSWSSSPIGRGRGPTGSRSSSVRRACLSSGCPAWLRVLAGPSSRSTPGARDSPKRATVAAVKKKARSERWQACALWRQRPAGSLLGLSGTFR